MAEAAPFMKGNVIDGKAVAGAIRKQIAARVSQLKDKHGQV
jgi:5,10-methylene-tetrahydrofolate dehydrogenase/methenyl tetrahydrofolate cyclohydrolase